MQHELSPEEGQVIISLLHNFWDMISSPRSLWGCKYRRTAVQDFSFIKWPPKWAYLMTKHPFIRRQSSLSGCFLTSQWDLSGPKHPVTINLMIKRWSSVLLVFSMPFLKLKSKSQISAGTKELSMGINDSYL